MDQIAILMPTYNGEKYIEQQISSILEQNNTNWHLYIRDDGSSDSTLHIINSKFAAIKNITVINDNPGNLGIRKSYETLMDKVSSEYYMFCDQDDFWLKDKIQVSFDEIKRLEHTYGENSPLLVHSDLAMTDQNLIPISGSYYHYWKEMPSSCLNKNLIRCTVTGCTTLFNRRLRDLYLQNTTPELAISKTVLHDYWISIICSIFGHQCYIDQPLTLYRRHNDNSSSVAKKSFLNKLRNIPAKIRFLKKINHDLRSGIKYVLKQNKTLPSTTASILNDFISLTGKKALLPVRFNLMLKNKFLYDTVSHNIIWVLSLI